VVKRLVYRVHILGGREKLQRDGARGGAREARAVTGAATVPFHLNGIRAARELAVALHEPPSLNVTVRERERGAIRGGVRGGEPCSPTPLRTTRIGRARTARTASSSRGSRSI